jgi:hypothetical protein
MVVGRPARKRAGLRGGFDSKKVPSSCRNAGAEFRAGFYAAGVFTKDRAMPTFGYVKTSLRIAVCVAAGVLFAMAVIAPRDAAAQMLKCESRSLGTDDEASLRAKARGMLPKSTRIETVDSCRNPNSTRAWISTRNTRTPEGVQQWWEMSCQRQTALWGCDPPAFKQRFDMHAPLGDRQREIALTFDRETPLSEAQSRASKALAVYFDPVANPPECPASTAVDSEWAKLRETNPLPRGNEPIHVTVTLNEGAHSVMLNDIDIEIRWPLGGADSATEAEACWQVWIVVT